MTIRSWRGDLHSNHLTSSGLFPRRFLQKKKEIVQHNFTVKLASSLGEERGPKGIFREGGGVILIFFFFGGSGKISELFKLAAALLSKPSVILLLTGVSKQDCYFHWWPFIITFNHLAECFFFHGLRDSLLIQWSSALEWSSGYLAVAFFHDCGIHGNVVGF